MDINDNRRWVAVILVVAATGLSACARSSTLDSEAATDEGPARVEPVDGTDLQRVVLSARAARRVGIETARVRVAQGHRTLVPYAAVMYGAAGNAFVYTNPKRLTYVRRAIAIARIDGGAALATRGPPSGTAVVTVGAAELLGTEYGVEE
jgi:hypothetical protein